MKKKLINEIRRFQKIAGLISEMELGLKPDQLEEDDYDMGTPSGDTDAMNIAEVDIDLSTTPRFNQEPNLSDKDFLNFVWDSIHDWIEHKFGTIDPANRRSTVEQFLNGLPDSDLRDYWDDYIERKRRGIEENDIDLSDTPEFFSEPDMWDESFRSFVWDIVGDYYEELYGTIDLDDIDDIIGQYLMNLPYDKLKALWGDYTKHKRTGLKESNIDLSNTPEFTDEKKEFYVYDIEGMEAPFGPFTQEKAYKVMKKLKNDSGEDYGVVNGKVAREIWGLQEDIDLSNTPEFTDLSKSKIQREFEKAGVNVKRPIFVYSIDYGMAKRSVGEYIDEILDTVYDLESDPEYEDSYGDVELEIVSNPDNIDPFDFFVEDDPKDIKLKVLIQGAVDDLIFQK